MRGHDRWLESRWLSMLPSLGIADDEAARYLRVKRLEVSAGRVSAQVRDRAGRNCDVQIRFTPFTDGQWERVVQALSSQALYAAELLAGHMPPELEAVFAQLGLALLPAAPGEVDARCSCCGAPVPPCAEIGAVYRELGRMLADDPWLLFQLRGRDRQPIMRALQERRSALAEGTVRSAPFETPLAVLPALAPALQPAGERPDGLLADATGFWALAERLDDLHHPIAAPAMDLLLLRRLGPPPLGAEADAYAALAGIYHLVTQRALELAYAVDPDEDAAAADAAG
jgi:uncharacterized Zn finger protein